MLVPRHPPGDAPPRQTPSNKRPPRLFPPHFRSLDTLRGSSWARMPSAAQLGRAYTWGSYTRCCLRGGPSWRPPPCWCSPLRCGRNCWRGWACGRCTCTTETTCCSYSEWGAFMFVSRGAACLVFRAVACLYSGHPLSCTAAALVDVRVQRRGGGPRQHQTTVRRCLCAFKTATPGLHQAHRRPTLPTQPSAALLDRGPVCRDGAAEQQDEPHHPNHVPAGLCSQLQHAMAGTLGMLSMLWHPCVLLATA